MMISFLKVLLKNLWRSWLGYWQGASLAVDVGLLAVVGLRCGQWCQYLFVVPKYRYQCPYSTIIHEP